MPAIFTKYENEAGCRFVLDIGHVTELVRTLRGLRSVARWRTHCTYATCTLNPPGGARTVRTRAYTYGGLQAGGMQSAQALLGEDCFDSKERTGCPFPTGRPFPACSPGRLTDRTRLNYQTGGDCRTHTVPRRLCLRQRSSVRPTERCVLREALSPSFAA